MDRRTEPFIDLLGPWFNIKMSSYQYRKSHCGDKTIYYDRLISTMGFRILVKRHLYTESGPWSQPKRPTIKSNVDCDKAKRLTLSGQWYIGLIKGYSPIPPLLASNLNTKARNNHQRKAKFPKLRYKKTPYIFAGYSISECWRYTRYLPRFA